MLHLKRIRPGFYEVLMSTPDGPVRFDIIRREDSLWYWVATMNPNEGGQDLFRSKSAAIEALAQYCRYRQYVTPWGWCYVPPSATL